MLNVSCPICAKPVPWEAAQTFKPFCSAQCQQQDLGAWANEDYKFPGQIQDGTAQQDADVED